MLWIKNMTTLNKQYVPPSSKTVEGSSRNKSSFSCLQYVGGLKLTAATTAVLAEPIHAVTVRMVGHDILSEPFWVPDEEEFPETF